ncbi:hypothetical protein BH09PAT4_BH09PAT4_09160 [soil metagenome]
MCADVWNVPLRAIGWLEHPHPFTQGSSTDGLRDELRQCIDSALASNCYIGYMGLHQCSLCAAQGTESMAILESSLNIFVPGPSCVYMFSAGIHHYIEEHAYRPPLVFYEAIAAIEGLSPPQYRSALVQA